MTVRIMVGDALSQLATLPGGSVHCAQFRSYPSNLASHASDGSRVVSQFEKFRY